MKCVHSILENMCLNQAFQINPRNFNFLVALLRFCFTEKIVKSKILGFFLHPFVATFNETCTPTWGKHVAEKKLVVPNFSEELQYSFGFALVKQPKNLNLQSFLPLKYPWVATFKETRAVTSRKNVSEPGKSISDLAKKLRRLSWHYSDFTLQKQ